ncbi:MAG: hypothetical protein GU359_05925 [Desulfurococcales archaeon]|jgi:uncharacterized protein (TIGR00290 family)|nr:hypothetical protein [Desulfurococcales archaeon]
MLVISWSGGKDSYLAYHLMREKGFEISYSIHMITEDVPNYHGPEDLLMAQQTQCLDMKSFIVKTTWSDYEKDFKKILLILKRRGVEGVVFGDIFLKDHIEWGRRVASEIGLKAFHPLYEVYQEHGDENKLIELFLRIGVRAMVVRTIDKEPLTSLLGRYVDKDLFDILSINNMDPFGEYGEYHSIVLSAPYMKCEIDVLKGSVEKMTTYFNNKIISHMIYRIEEYKITDKHEKMLSKSF